MTAEQIAAEIVERRGPGLQPPLIVAGHSSGKWSRNDSAAFDRNVRTMRRGRSVVTRTELPNAAGHTSLQIKGDGWGVWHPHTEHGFADCSIEWDQAIWSVEDRGLLRLTETRIRTAKGFLLPPSEMPWAYLVARQDSYLWGARLLISTGHHNLDNTPTRAAAWRDEGKTFSAWQARKGKQLGKLTARLHIADVNKDFRKLGERADVREHFLHGTGLHNLWASVSPLPKTGTHGLQLLDQGFANRPGVIGLAPDDSSSDHRPVEVRLQAFRR